MSKESELILEAIKGTMEGQHQNGLDILYELCGAKLESGALDLSDPNISKQAIARVVLHVSLLDLADDYAPETKTFKKMAANLRYF